MSVDRGCFKIPFPDETKTVVQFYGIKVSNIYSFPNVFPLDVDSN